MKPYYEDDLVTLHHGDAQTVAAALEPRSVRTIVTSPPYFGLRDYGEAGQIGAEETLDEYVDRLVSLFRVLREVLTDDGTLWLNLGDSYSGAGPSGASYDSETTRRRAAGNGTDGKFRVSKRLAERDLDYSKKKPKPTSGIPSKNLLGVPWRVAFALQDDGWILRSDIIWAKPNPMPESVTDRPTKAHEYLFLLAKSPRYYYDAEAIQEKASGNDARPQLQRARKLAAQAGLTDEHMAAIRSAGATDAGKARTTQDGTGKNTDRVMALAAEAKTALGGYYREFLLGESRNVRTVWNVPTVPFPGAHFAVYPPELIRPCILAGSAPGDTVLDPFSGSGTTGYVATQEGRRYVGIDLNREYLDLSLRTRFAQPVLNMTGGDAA